MPFRKSRTLKLAVLAVGLGSILGVAGISAASDSSSGPPRARTLAGGDLSARRDEVFNKLAGLGGERGFAVGVDPTKNKIHAFLFGPAASTDVISGAELGSDVAVDRVEGAAAPANDAFSGSVLGRDAATNPAGHICKQGRTTGTTCGSVTPVDTRISYGASTDDRGNRRPAYQIDHAFITNNCVEGGDSGGPVYSNTGSNVQALGIVSGAVTSTVRGSGPPLCLEKLGGNNVSFMIPFGALPVTTNPFDRFTLAVG